MSNGLLRAYQCEDVYVKVYAAVHYLHVLSCQPRPVKQHLFCKYVQRCTTKYRV